MELPPPSSFEHHLRPRRTAALAAAVLSISPLSSPYAHASAETYQPHTFATAETDANTDFIPVLTKATAEDMVEDPTPVLVPRSDITINGEKAVAIPVGDRLVDEEETDTEPDGASPSPTKGSEDGTISPEIAQEDTVNDPSDEISIPPDMLTPEEKEVEGQILPPPEGAVPTPGPSDLPLPPGAEVVKPSGEGPWYTTRSRHGVGEKVPTKWKGHIYFNQHDERWGGKKYGHNTMSASACGPTSMAIVYANLMNDLSITPYEVAKFNVKNGYRASVGTSHAAFAAGAKYFGKDKLAMKHIPETVGAIKSITDAGGYIITNGTDRNPRTPATTGGHIFVIRGVTPEGKLLVLDPNSLQKTSVAYTAKEIFGPSSVTFAVTKK